LNLGSEWSLAKNNSFWPCFIFLNSGVPVYFSAAYWTAGDWKSKSIFLDAAISFIYLADVSGLSLSAIIEGSPFFSEFLNTDWAYADVNSLNCLGVNNCLAFVIDNLG